MLIELEKEDLVSLVRGQDPYYSIFEEKLVKENGYYVGGMSDRWVWNSYSLKELKEEELWELYLMCKKSYK